MDNTRKNVKSNRIFEPQIMVDRQIRSCILIIIKGILLHNKELTSISKIVKGRMSKILDILINNDFYTSTCILQFNGVQWARSKYFHIKCFINPLEFIKKKLYPKWSTINEEKLLEMYNERFDNIMMDKLKSFTFESSDVYIPFVDINGYIVNKQIKNDDLVNEVSKFENYLINKYLCKYAIYIYLRENKYFMIGAKVPEDMFEKHHSNLGFCAQFKIKGRKYYEEFENFKTPIDYYNFPTKIETNLLSKKQSIRYTHTKNNNVYKLLPNIDFYKDDLIKRFRLRTYFTKILSSEKNIDTIATTTLIGRQSNIDTEETINQLIDFLQYKSFNLKQQHIDEIIKIINERYNGAIIVKYKKTKVFIKEVDNRENKITIYIPFWLRRYSKFDLENLTLRYASTYSSHLWNVPKYFYDYLYHSFNVEIEGFASPLNRFFPKYCSPFPEDSIFVERIGNFFNMDIGKLIENTENKCINIVASPPYYNPICKKLVDKVIDDVNKFNCRYFLVLPGWTYVDWYNKLSNFTMTNNNCYFKQFGKGEVYYRDETISKYIFPPISTLFCIICGTQYPLSINDVNNYKNASELLLKKNIPVIKVLQKGDLHNFETFRIDKDFVYNHEENNVSFSFKNDCNFFIGNNIYYAKKECVYRTNSEIIYKKRKTVIFTNGMILPRFLLSK